MALDRRGFLQGAGGVLAAGTLAGCDGEETAEERADRATPQAAPLPDGADWAAVRAQFALSPDFIHMSALLIASHPSHVRAAIERHRRGLDRDPVTYLETNSDELRRAVLAAAGAYLDVEAAGIALTDSTTMGIGLIYNGLDLRPGDEVLFTENDYYATDKALRLAAARTAAELRAVPLYDDIGSVSAEEIVGRLRAAITPRTRVLAATWVHSSTGLKLPLAGISAMLDEVNAEREVPERVLFCVDGVHGFGVEDATLPGLGCDVLMAGCHKWLFGPRGTGIVAAHGDAWARMRPIIPSFTDDESWLAWLQHRAPSGTTGASAMTPGGFKPFEHRWAMTQAFELHQAIGKDNVAARTHALAGQLKEGLAGIAGVRLRTPRPAALSAGIVCFDVDGLSPAQAVAQLRERRLIASATPYATSHVRLTPSIRNTPDEVERALGAVRAMVG